MRTLAEAHEDWQTTRSIVKPLTSASNNSHWRNHIGPALGTRDLESLTRADIARFIGELAATLNPRTVRNITTTLAQILDHAVDAGAIQINPSAGVRRPRSPRMRPDNVLSPAQVAQMAALHGDGGNVTVALAWTGLRWSELVGLRVADFIVNPYPVIHVRRQAQRVPARGVVDSTPKSHAARTVPVPSPTLDVFKRAISGKSPTDPIFTSQRGTLLHPSNWRRQVHWPETLAAMHLVGFRPHDLRHTAASYWIACGADIKTVQAILGHASGQMTLDVYGHLMDQGLTVATQRINDWANSSVRREGLS